MPRVPVSFLSPRQVDEILKSLDLDQNGQIEWSEFASLMADRWLRQDGGTVSRARTRDELHRRTASASASSPLLCGISHAPSDGP